VNDPLTLWSWFSHGLRIYTAATAGQQYAADRIYHPFIQACRDRLPATLPLMTLALLDGDPAWALVLGDVTDPPPDVQARGGYAHRQAWWDWARRLEGWMGGLALSAFDLVEIFPPKTLPYAGFHGNGWRTAPERGSTVSTPFALVEQALRSFLLRVAAEKGTLRRSFENGEEAAEAALGPVEPGQRVVRTLEGYFVLPESFGVICERGVGHSFDVLLLNDFRAIEYRWLTAYDLISEDP
jgi:hypothetical protein